MADLHLHPYVVAANRAAPTAYRFTYFLRNSRLAADGPRACRRRTWKTSVNLDANEKAASSLEDDWEHDPMNARNWPSSRKWTAVCIVGYIVIGTGYNLEHALQVSFYTLIPPPSLKHDGARSPRKYVRSRTNNIHLTFILCTSRGEIWGHGHGYDSLNSQRVFDILCYWRT